MVRGRASSEGRGTLEIKPHTITLSLVALKRKRNDRVALMARLSPAVYSELGYAPVVSVELEGDRLLFTPSASGRVMTRIKQAGGDAAKIWIATLPAMQAISGEVCKVRYDGTTASVQVPDAMLAVIQDVMGGRDE